VIFYSPTPKYFKLSLYSGLLSPLSSTKSSNYVLGFAHDSISTLPIFPSLFFTLIMVVIIYQLFIWLIAFLIMNRYLNPLK